MRIRQQLALPLGRARGHLHVVPVALPVAVRGPGRHALLRPVERLADHRDGVEAQLRRDFGAAADFQQVADQAEARDVGDRVHVRHLRQRLARRIEPRGEFDHLAIARRG